MCCSHKFLVCIIVMSILDCHRVSCSSGPFRSLDVTITVLLSLGLWGTTLTENNANNREQFVRTTIRELLVYLVFLVDICLCKCFIQTSPFLHLLEFYIFKDKDVYETALCVVFSTFLCQIWFIFLAIFFFKVRRIKHVLLH